MRNIIILSLILFLSLPVLAQKENTMINYPLQLGLFIEGKGGVNSADIPQGIKNGFSINGMPDIGLTAYFPFTKDTKIGATLDLSYSSLAYDLKLYSDESIKTTVTYNYFTIVPNIHIYGFMLGFGFNLPLDIKREGKSYVDFMYNVSKDNLQSLVDFRLGGMIPLYADNTGRLNLLIGASIALTGAYDEAKLGSSLSAYNPKPASAHLGINYLFNLVNYFKQD